MRSSNTKTFFVTVKVNGRAWRLVASLAGAGPRDRVYVVTRTSDGGTVVEFGDGVHGALPPEGGTITAAYSTGGGAAGNSATVVVQRAATEPTRDQALRVVIRNRTRAISFKFREQRRARSRKI